MRLASPTVDCDLLTTAVRDVGSLSLRERDELFELLSSYYDNVTRGQFDRDLDEKQYVIIGRGQASGCLRGFTTLRRIEVAVNERRIGVIVTGDTLLAAEDWASGTAVKSWWQQMMKMAHSSHAAPVYWVSFLESYRVYRLLGGLFREFHPRAGSAMPDELRAIRDAVARIKYPKEFAAVQGLVRPQNPTPVRENKVQASTAPGDDPASASFVALNPGYLGGDYLVCIAGIAPSNLTRLARRLAGTTAAAAAGQPLTIHTESATAADDST